MFLFREAGYVSTGMLCNTHGKKKKKNLLSVFSAVAAENNTADCVCGLIVCVEGETFSFSKAEVFIKQFMSPLFIKSIYKAFMTQGPNRDDGYGGTKRERERETGNEGLGANNCFNFSCKV